MKHMKHIKLFETFDKQVDEEKPNLPYREFAQNDNPENALPTEVLLNGEKYVGEGSFINGFNGHSTSKDDSFLCALINKSLWNADRVPNYLTTLDGDLIYSPRRRGTYIEFK